MENVIEQVFAAGCNQGFLEGIAWVARNQQLVSQVANQILKVDEEIASRNATVMVDSRGEISWINNNFLPMVWPNTEED